MKIRAVGADAATPRGGFAVKGLSCDPMAHVQNSSILLPGSQEGTTTDPPEGRVVGEQAKQNRSTANQWSLYATHRRAIEKLLVPEQRGIERLCVVGAGNCNDLDLRWLVESYREVHLVDIDPKALTAAVERQRVAGSPKIHLHAPIDLTGCAAEIGRWPVQPPSFQQIDELSQRIGEGPRLPLPGEFDLILSPCVLTQLISPFRKALGEDHPKFPVLRFAIRDGHLRSLARLLRPGGRAVLAIDLVSSKTFPDLPRVSVEDLPDLMTTLIRGCKTYPGLDPSSLATAVRGNSLLRPFYDVPRFSPPWHWHLSLQRTFLVYGFTLRRTLLGL